MAFLRKNFAKATLDGVLLAGSGTLTVLTGHTLPVIAGQMRLTIWNVSAFPDPADDPDLEIVTAVYSGTSNIYNITRAQENTSDVLHPSGSRIALHYTAGMSDDDIYDSSDFNSDFAGKDLDDLAAGTTNVHLTTALRTNYNAAYSHISSTGASHSYIDQNVTTVGTPTFANITDSSLTANRLISSNGSKVLTSVPNLQSWIAGTNNRINVTDDTDGTVTLSTPQDIHTGATNFTVAGATIGGVQIPLVFTEGLNEPTGFLNRTDSTISFVDGTRTFTIEPAVDEFEYYHKAIKYTIDVAKTLVIADTEGLHAIYFNGDVLSELINPTESQEVTIIKDYVFVAYVYWDATNNSSIILADERHSSTMSGSTHAYLHETLHTRWLSGLAISPESVDGSGDDPEDARVSLSSGFIQDEDLNHTIDDTVQDITPIARIPVYYLDGTSWRKDIATDYPVKPFVGGGGRLAWNNAGTQTEVDTLDLVLCHVFATNNINEPIIAIQGQAGYNTLALARVGAEVEISNLVVSGLPIEEFVPLATIIFQTATGYTNAVKARVRTTDSGDSHIDWRFTNLNAITGTVSDHGSLSGLADDDHTQYVLANGTRAMTGLTITGFNGIVTAVAGVLSASNTLDLGSSS